jgi:hypothetical protein
MVATRVLTQEKLLIPRDIYRRGCSWNAQASAAQLSTPIEDIDEEINSEILCMSFDFFNFLQNNNDRMIIFFFSRSRLVGMHHGLLEQASLENLCGAGENFLETRRNMLMVRLS